MINVKRATIETLEKVAELRAKKLDITVDEARRQVALAQGFLSWTRMVELRQQ